MIFLVAYVVLVGLVASMTKLAWDDEITAPLRVRIREYAERTGRFANWARALECPRCTSVRLSWFATPPVLAVLAYAHDASPAWWAITALSAPLVAFSAAYYAYILILRGEA
jgi:hypothetical protein